LFAWYNKETELLPPDAFLSIIMHSNAFSNTPPEELTALIPRSLGGLKGLLPREGEGSLLIWRWDVKGVEEENEVTCAQQ